MEKKKPSLTVALAVYNEEANLSNCLNSVMDITDEIVIVDGGSSDASVSLARKYTKHVYVTDNPAIFHINKQKAIEKATGKWILQLDADEIIPPDLKLEILSIIQLPDAVSKEGYYIARKNYFMKRWMKKGGMYPDYVIRLFKNGKGNFPCKSVHEQITIDGNVGYLKHPMIHEAYPTFSDYLRKADTYTSLTSTEFKKQNLPKNLYTACKYILIKPVHIFAVLYLRHRGFEDGLKGFIWAMFSGLHFAQAYLKYIKSL